MSEVGIGSPETGVVDGCKPPYGCWESQPVFLSTEPSLVLLSLLLYTTKDHLPKSTISQESASTDTPRGQYYAPISQFRFSLPR